tara:strand:- start:2485 stop:2592 length:108 start_codon:yes stop_codon:yes gene_type:complete
MDTAVVTVAFDNIGGKPIATLKAFKVHIATDSSFT